MEFLRAVTKEGTHTNKKWKCKFGRPAEVFTAVFGFCLGVFLTCGFEEWFVIQMRYSVIQCLISKYCSDVGILQIRLCL